MLAREIELTGIPTVTVTMVPFIAERFRLSRIVGVQFPFGHAFGMPDDPTMQRAVSEAAVRLLETATEPETRLDMEIAWPIDDRTTYRDWQPTEPSPSTKLNLERRQRLEEQRAGRAG